VISHDTLAPGHFDEPFAQMKGQQDENGEVDPAEGNGLFLTFGICAGTIRYSQTEYHRFPAAIPAARASLRCWRQAAAQPATNDSRLTYRLSNDYSFTLTLLAGWVQQDNFREGFENVHPRLLGRVPRRFGNASRRLIPQEPLTNSF